MALSITHAAVVVTADDVTSEVGSNEWNAAHTLTGTVSIAQGGTNATSFTSNALNYFDGTSIASVAGTSWDNTNRSLTLTGATVTTSNPILNLTQTWNAGAVTFTALKLNVTNTASAAASLLLDLQVGGASKFSLGKSGDLYGYNTNDGSGNYERGVFDWTTTANVLTIGTQALGTGTIRNVELVRGGTTQIRLAAGSVNFLVDQFNSGSVLTASGGANFFGMKQGATTTESYLGYGGTVSLANKVLIWTDTDSVIIGRQAIATNATDGFLYIPTCAGTPTGTPTAYTGRVAIVYDTTNNKFYVYNGAWKGGTAPGVWS